MQVGEASEALIDCFATDGELCPCCLRPKHPSGTLREQPAEIVSDPAALACEPLVGAGDGRFASARHHLVPARCWALVTRLARIGAAVGFDINHPGNGTSLPAPAASYRHDGREVAFGALPADRRAAIARYWMRELGLPWHDGAQAGGDAETSPATLPDEGEIAHPGYDQAVIARLVRELAALTREAPCRDPADRAAEIRTRLESLSDEIRARLAAFAGDPRACAPYFPSAAAAAFAVAAAADGAAA